mmetsp:Transcript_38130/g.124727  ORF Transcript_38130/g.124727 Transcript_38130/m.124727 type:complete len:246 (-) Transcript_38130:345-1082(-)
MQTRAADWAATVSAAAAAPRRGRLPDQGAGPHLPRPVRDRGGLRGARRRPRGARPPSRRRASRLHRLAADPQVDPNPRVLARRPLARPGAALLLQGDRGRRGGAAKRIPRPQGPAPRTLDRRLDQPRVPRPAARRGALRHLLRPRHARHATRAAAGGLLPHHRPDARPAPLRRGALPRRLPPGAPLPHRRQQSAAGRAAGRWRRPRRRRARVRLVPAARGRGRRRGRRNHAAAVRTLGRRRAAGG